MFGVCDCIMCLFVENPLEEGSGQMIAKMDSTAIVLYIGRIPLGFYEKKWKVNFHFFCVCEPTRAYRHF